MHLTDISLCLYVFLYKNVKCITFCDISFYSSFAFFKVILQ